MSSGGSVRQRRSGAKPLWEGRYRGPDGRQHSLYAPSKREAQERLRAALTAADHGVRPATERVTTGAYLEEWVTGIETRLRPRTVESYRATVRLYIVPTIGSIPLTRLEPEHVTRMLAAVTARGVSPTTVRYAYAVLRIALGRAAKAGRVPRNVATLIDAPSKARPEMRPLTAAQVRALLSATRDDRLAGVYQLAVATGMREGELLALRWEDIDFDRGWLSVRHTLRRGDRALAQPKTERARRTLRLGASTVAMLREQRRRQAEERLAAGRRWQDDGFVFTTRHGEPLHARTVLRAFQAAVARAGLPRQRFHDLRHAYATLMIEAGEELAVVSRTLGHADLSTTADIYSHLTPAMLERSAARMEAILVPDGAEAAAGS